MLINTISGKYIVEFGRGKFDDWCVYLSGGALKRYAPLDTQYFSFFKALAARYETELVYHHFTHIYELTTATYNAAVIDLIKTQSLSYGIDAEAFEVWFSVIYGGMIAEENKANVILKKRIKRLGMHQVLIEGHEPAVAAKFSFGKKWRELDVLMRERGF